MKRVADGVDVLMAIDTYIEHYGTPPSVRILAMMLGYNSVSGVHYRLRCLVAEGYITRQPRRARSIRLTSKAFVLLTNIQEVA